MTMLAVLLVSNFLSSVPEMALSMLDVHHITLPRVDWLTAQCKLLSVDFENVQAI